MEGFVDDAIIFDKSSVVPYRTQKSSQLLDCFGYWLGLHVFYLSRVCSYSSTADYVAQVLHL
jgi:hypothetical protein